MPFIDVKITETLTKEKEQSLKALLGRAIECLPGKTEAWLMIGFTDNCRLWFKGTADKPCAYIEVKVFGKIDPTAANKMTREICNIFEAELCIPKDQTYIKYEETSLWGWNGSNF